MIRRLILGIVIAMSCRTFQYFPGMAPVQEAWFVTCFLYLLTLYPFFKRQTGWHFSKFERYILMMMAVVPLLSAFAGWQQFGQPFAYGVLAQRGIILLAGSLMLLDGFRHRFFTLKDLEKTLVGLGWFVTILNLSMRVFLDPRDFLEYSQGFVTQSPDHTAFVIPLFFPIFALFYYAFLGFRTRQVHYYLVTPVFIIALLNNNGARALTVALALTFLFFVYRWGGFMRGTLLCLRLGVALVFILGAVYLITPDTVASRASKFADAFTVAATGQEVQDLSATLRIYEVANAIRYIPEHPIIGNGLISHQWSGGFDSLMGEYFDPSDIGWLGVVYVYGALGFLLFAWQYVFALKAVRQKGATIRSPLLDTTKGVLLVTAIYSVTASHFAFFPEATFMFGALLQCILVESVPLRERFETSFPRMKFASSTLST